ncbi:MAG: hypothetical protein ABEJ79_00975 [Halolamina sp.]
MCRATVDCDRRPSAVVVLGPSVAVADCCGGRAPPATLGSPDDRTDDAVETHDGG